MAELPLLIFPEPHETKRHKPGGGPQKRPHFPSSSRQLERLSPKFDELERSFERAKLQLDPAGAEPEMVLVLETVGRIDEFFKAVGRVEGLEWLGDWDEDYISPDEDFYYEGKLTKDLTGRLYLIMTNQRGMRELLSLWKRYKKNPDSPKFGYGRTKWRDLFGTLRDIRPWGAEDRLRETGLLEDWRARVKAGEERVRAEIELWYRESEALRMQTENTLKKRVQEVQGQVLKGVCIPEIAYHALLAELPIDVVKDFYRRSQKIKLLHCDKVMFFRPVGQIVGIIPYDESSLEPWEGGEFPKPRPKPIVALLDGLPLENHKCLDGRLIVDDPDNWAGDYPVRDRKHGTAMASLILRGELDAEELPLPNRIYVRPIMKPESVDPRTNEGLERIPEDALPVDLVHRAVRRLFEGEGGEGSVASSIRIINLSIADPERPFDRSPSPWARLLDWLSWKYKVLFVVSAGNYERDIDISDIRRQDFGSLRTDARLLRQQICRALNNDARNRRLLSPAESINALTVAALHSDASSGDAYHGYVVDPLPLDSSVLPSPVNAQGSGFRRAIKPDVLFPGGRQLYREKMHRTSANVVLEPVRTILAPGQKVAVPRAGDLTFTGYTRGTSNAAALATRAAARLYEKLGDLRNEPGIERLTDSYISVLLKALLVHGAYWGGMWDALAEKYLETNDRNAIARLLGYGRADIARVLFCTEQRATLIGWGDIADGEAQRYSLPLPDSLSGKSEWRRLIITLGWFTPINPKHQRYRRAHLWFAPYGETSSHAGARDLLGTERRDADWQSVRRGTLQHEIFEGDKATPFEQGAELLIQVNCRADAGGLPGNVPYAIAVTLEVAPEIDLPIYEEIRARILVRIAPEASLDLT